MNLVRRLFPFRTCTIDIKDGERALQRPCLLYHIKRCQGPCIEAISKAAYRADIEQVELFLEGRQETLVEGAARRDGARLGAAATTSSAAVVRDKIRAIERTMESQKMAAFARTELDLVGARPPGQPGGRPAVRHPRRQDARPRRVPPRRAARARPTTRSSGVPAPVLRPGDLERPAGGAGAARSREPRRRGARDVPAPSGGGSAASTCGSPQRGEKRAADGSSRRATPRRRSRASRPAGWPTRARRWARSRSSPTRWGCPGLPARIECYDISNFQGSESVG